ncbi:MAG: hypothetical protein IJ583_09095 [Firmicutes bacterium]|nr:hypothetical protein [Bacillota bacterium]
MAQSKIIKRNRYNYGNESMVVENKMEQPEEYHSKYGNKNKIDWGNARYVPVEVNKDPVLNSMASDIIAHNNESRGGIADLFNMSAEELAKKNEAFPTTESQLKMAEEESPVVRKN